MEILQEFEGLMDVIELADYSDITARLVATLNWIERKEELGPLINALKKENVEELIETANMGGRPPLAVTAAQIAAVGYAIIQICRDQNAQLFNVALSLHVQGSYGNSDADSLSDGIMQRFVKPFLNSVSSYLRSKIQKPPTSTAVSVESTPPEILHSLPRFRNDYPDYSKVGFLIMRFEETPAHAAIQRILRETVQPYGLSIVRADERRYHDDLFTNVLTYLHGCSFGVAVFERITSDDFNPNVSLEVGYLMAMRKPVILLKDQNLRAMQTDLVGRIYDPFDFQNPESSIPKRLHPWLRDKGIIV